MSEEVEVIRSSGNVFADLGRPNPEEHLLKAKLVSRIQTLLDQNGMTNAEAAERLGTTEADVEGLLRGRFRSVSLDQLVQYLQCLGYRVELSATLRASDREVAEPAMEVEREVVLA